MNITRSSEIVQERLTDKEGLYTIRTDGFMKGYAQQLSPDGYFNTLGLLSHEQVTSRLHAQGYEVVRYLPQEEASKLARMRREQHRPAEPKKTITGFDIFCIIAEIMELREQRRLRQELEDAVKEELKKQV
jgi:hypothetical protein